MDMDLDMMPANFDMNKVHVELEKLNIATDVINKLELQLDDARAAFREIQNYWTQRLDSLLKRNGTSIEKARPYYEARMKLRDAQQEAQKAAVRFERANSMHSVAKQQVSLTQESLARQGTQNVDPACLEVLNHHIQRVNEAERERIVSEDEHRRLSRCYHDANDLVNRLEKEFKRAIKQSQPYFEARVEFTKVLEKQKDLIRKLEAEIKQKKRDYAASLKRLEEISEEIHESRMLGKRAPGVGSETPGPPVTQDTNSTPTTEEVIMRRKKSASLLQALPALKKPGAQQTSPNRPGDLLSSDDRRNRSASAPPDSTVTSAGTAKPPFVPLTRISSGVILLAQQLSHYDHIIGEDNRVRAFSFPPDECDYHYKTMPDGVRPFPTPPQSPNEPTTPSSKIPTIAIEQATPKKASLEMAKHAIGPGLGVSPAGSAASSECASISSVDDDAIDKFLKNHDELIDSIERSEDSGSEDRILRELMSTEKMAKTAAADVPDRSSGSGAEDVL